LFIADLQTGRARHRSVRVDQAEILPGLPDATPGLPPKAREYEALTLDQAIEKAHRILDAVLDGIWVDSEITDRTTGAKAVLPRKRRLAPPDSDKVFTLFSGGGDSSILAHLMRQRSSGMVHVRTGISVPATWSYVQDVATAWGAPLHEANPEDSFKDLVLGRVVVKTDRGKMPKGSVLWSGFPGPAGHAMMYQRLKERALDHFRSSLVGPRGRSGQMVFLSGMRWAESDRRFRNAEEYDAAGSVVWCSPLVWWTSGHMAEYRDRHLCNDIHEHDLHRLCKPDVLPRSEVTDHLHMSGDCLCGAFASPGELGQVEFFYPDVAAQIRDLEQQAKAAGIKRCVWGAGKEPTDPESDGSPGRLCSKCVPPQMKGQVDLFTEWHTSGLLSDAQYAALSGIAA
jgi:3'-phosphoadenosine 5'-phosphosulfate sulfotransferase (PAPS reductase)/FAD synthetase